MEHSIPPQYLPEETVIDILSRLPVKALIRFCCVCRFWRNLITLDRDFIDSHLQNSLNSNPSRQKSLLMCSSQNFEECTCHEESNHDQVENLAKEFSNSEEGNLAGLVMLPRNFIVAGYSNGVICLYKFCRCGSEITVFLWNPVLHQFRALAGINYEQTHSGLRLDAVCFFFDPVSYDYKVVKILNFCDRFEVEIYSLNSNSSTLVCLDILPCNLQRGVHCSAVVHNGFPHWLACSLTYYSFILNVFDMTEEKVREILLPDFLSDIHRPHLAIFKGCLSLSVWNLCDCGFELWVMQGNGRDNSWVKQLAIPRNLDFFPLFCRTTDITASGKLWCRKGRDAILYDLENQRVEKSVQTSKDVLSRYVAADYVPSLVSVVHRDKNFVRGDGKM